MRVTQVLPGVTCTSIRPLDIRLHSSMGIEHYLLEYWNHHVGCTLACGTRVKYHHYSFRNVLRAGHMVVAMLVTVMCSFDFH